MSKSAHSVKGNAEARILSSAAAMFASFGYNGVSTRDIATQAGVNEVTIYRHYPRKRDLYLAVLEAELRQVTLRSDLLARLAEAADGRTAVERTFELLNGILSQRSDLLRLIQFSALELGDDIDPLLRRYLGEFVEVAARYLDPWVAKGDVRCTSARDLVLALFGILLSHRPLQRLFPGDSVRPQSLLNAYADYSATE